MTSILVYDCEIKNAIPGDGHRDPELTYCEGWRDFTGMGISVITAYDGNSARPHVYMGDNVEMFAALVEQRDLIVGWNNWRFDDPLVAAAGIHIPREKSLDIQAHIARAAGFCEGDHPRGLGLDDCCLANKLPGKDGVGAMAPWLYQRGRYGTLIDYCLGDTLATLRIYRYIKQAGGLTDPRNGAWLAVVLSGESEVAGPWRPGKFGPFWRGVGHRRGWW